MRDYPDGASSPQLDDVTNSLLLCVREAYGPQTRTASPSDAFSSRSEDGRTRTYAAGDSSSASAIKSLGSADPTIRGRSDRNDTTDGKQGSLSDPPPIDFEPGRPRRADESTQLPQQEKLKQDAGEKNSRGIAESDKRLSPLVALDKLKELPALTRLTDTLKEKGIESASFSEKDGKLVVHVTNDKARHVELNEKLGFGTVKSVDIAKEVTCTISRTEKGLKIEDWRDLGAGKHTR